MYRKNTTCMYLYVSCVLKLYLNRNIFFFNLNFKCVFFKQLIFLSLNKPTQGLDKVTYLTSDQSPTSCTSLSGPTKLKSSFIFCYTSLPNPVQKKKNIRK